MPADRRITRYGRLRMLVLSASFLLLVINPLLNYYLHIGFIQGWYQSLGIGELWIVSPLEGLESMLTSQRIYMPTLFGMLIPVVIAMLLGRIFCSWVCPVSFLGELSDRIRRRIAAKRFRSRQLQLPRSLLWYVLVAEIILSLILGAPIFVFLSPPGLVGRELMLAVFFHTLAVEGIVIIGVLVLDQVSRRMFCRYFCPLGALLALLGGRRRLQVRYVPANCTGCGKCDQACPLTIRPSRGESTSIYCWNCGACIDSCRFDALSFQWGDHNEP